MITLPYNSYLNPRTSFININLPIRNLAIASQQWIALPFAYSLFYWGYLILYSRMPSRLQVNIPQIPLLQSSPLPSHTMFSSFFFLARNWNPNAWISSSSSSGEYSAGNPTSTRLKFGVYIHIYFLLC